MKETFDATIQKIMEFAKSKNYLVEDSEGASGFTIDDENFAHHTIKATKRTKKLIIEIHMVSNGQMDYEMFKLSNSEWISIPENQERVFKDFIESLIF